MASPRHRQANRIRTGIRAGGALLARLLVLAVLLQSLTPALPAAVAAMAGGGGWLEICTAEGHTLVPAPADGLPESGPGNDHHCGLCWGPGPVALAVPAVGPQTLLPPPADFARLLAGQAVRPPALFLSRLKSRAPPTVA